MEITQEDSFILIKFQGLNNAQPEIYFSNVNAFQIMGAALTLEVHGKNFFLQQENERVTQQQQNRLAVAKPTILKPGS